MCVNIKPDQPRLLALSESWMFRLTSRRHGLTGVLTANRGQVRQTGFLACNTQVLVTEYENDGVAAAVPLRTCSETHDTYPQHVSWQCVCGRRIGDCQVPPNAVCVLRIHNLNWYLHG